MAALLLPLTTRCWDLSPEVWGPANHPIYSRWHLPKSRLLSGRIAIGVTPEASGNYYHWLLDLVPRVLLLKHTAKIFPTTTRSCLTVRERITNEKSWPRLECPRRKFAMLIRANVSKLHRLFFLPWTSTLLL